MSKLLLLSICFTTVSLHAEISAQSLQPLQRLHVTKCGEAKTVDDRRLCKAVMSSFDEQDPETYREFELTSRRVDLNGDGRSETIAWISSWGGTGGQSLYVLSKIGGRYRKLWSEDSTWTPVLLLRGKSHGWNDFAFLVAGGGVDPHFVVVRNNGRSYKDFRIVKNRPRGETLIDQTWRWSTFGPSIHN